MGTTVEPEAGPSIDAEEQYLRELAKSLNCFTEAEHLLMSGWAVATAKAKRKRGESPPYVRHGKHYFYPRDKYAEYLNGRVRERSRAVAVAAL